MRNKIDILLERAKSIRVQGLLSTFDMMRDQVEMRLRFSKCNDEDLDFLETVALDLFVKFFNEIDEHYDNPESK